MPWNLIISLVLLILKLLLSRMERGEVVLSKRENKKLSEFLTISRVIEDKAVAHFGVSADQSPEARIDVLNRAKSAKKPKGVS